MKSKSVVYLLNGREHIYWILDLEGEVHSIWDLWISGLPYYKDNGIFKVSQEQTGRSFRSSLEKYGFFSRLLPLPESTYPKDHREKSS
jgi:hypothetical protein